MAEYRVAGLARGSGFVIQGLGGQAVPQYNLVFLSGVDLWSLADADAAASMPVVGLAVEPLSLNQFGRILLRGVVNNNVWTWTAGGEIYASTVAGGLTQTAPVGVGDVAQQVGVAITATKILFDPKGGQDTQAALIATGTYTGNGAATQAITGVGFQPIALRIVKYSIINTAAEWWKLDVYPADESDGHFDGSDDFTSDAIKTLDADGFTVGDTPLAGNHPNEDAVIYFYTAWG